MKKLLTISAVALVVLWGCRSKSHDFMAVEEDIIPVTQMEEVPPPPPPAYAAKAMDSYSSNAPAREQMLIKTAYLSLEVNSYEQYRAKVDSLAKIYKAWISSENMSTYDYRISNNITIKVPAHSLESLTNELMAIAKRIENQRIETLDVTEEFIDNESRLKNHRAVEQKFIALLKRTDSIEQILQIESKLAEVRSQIESIEGRLKYLSTRVSFSDLNLYIYQKIDFKYVPEPMESFWERFKKSINKGWTGFIAFVLFLFKLWPLWIVLVGLWFVYKWYRDNRKPIKAKKKAKQKDKGNPKHSKQEQTD
ncbi:MAG: DUF4349 domain-containing protein [Tenuifilaceae bacterium]|nr:DUF4349 domain-containing protein [Tenuifilaceae bacterium]